MIDAINTFPNQSLTEKTIKNTIRLKRTLGLGVTPKKTEKAVE